MILVALFCFVNALICSIDHYDFAYADLQLMSYLTPLKELILMHEFSDPSLKLFKTLLKDFSPDSSYQQIRSHNKIVQWYSLPASVGSFFFTIVSESSQDFNSAIRTYPLNGSYLTGGLNGITGKITSIVANRPVSSIEDLYPRDSTIKITHYPSLFVIRQPTDIYTNFLPLSLPNFATDSDGNSVSYRLVSFLSPCEGGTKILSFFARKDSSGNWTLQNESHDSTVRHYKYEDINSSFYSPDVILSRNIAFYVQESQLDSFFAFKPEKLENSFTDSDGAEIFLNSNKNVEENAYENAKENVEDKNSLIYYQNDKDLSILPSIDKNEPTKSENDETPNNEAPNNEAAVKTVEKTAGSKPQIYGDQSQFEPNDVKLKGESPRILIFNDFLFSFFIIFLIFMLL